MLTPVYADTIIFETRRDPIHIPSFSTPGAQLSDSEIKLLRRGKKKSGGFTKRLLKRAGKKKRSAPE